MGLSKFKLPNNYAQMKTFKNVMMSPDNSVQTINFSTFSTLIHPLLLAYTKVTIEKHLNYPHNP